MLSTVCLLVVLLGVVSVSAQLIELPLGNPNGLKVVLSPTSIIVSRQLSTSTTGEITVSLASIREVDNNLNQVSNPSNIVYGPAESIDTWRFSDSVQVECKIIKFSYSVERTADGIILFCVILNNGIIYYDAESVTVTKGQLMISMGSIVRWNPTGKYLEVKVSMSAIRGRKMSLTTGVPVELGLGTTDSYALLSTKVLTNTSNSYNTMPTGYPLVTLSNPVDNKASIIALLPRSGLGTGLFIWNVLIEPGYQSSSPGSASVVESWMILTITAALACLAGCFDRRH